MRTVGGLVLLVTVIGCSGRDTSDRVAVDSLLASYSPEFRIGATVGELKSVHSWIISESSDGEAVGNTDLSSRYGAATVAVFVDADGDSIDHADRAKGFIFVADSGDSRAAAAARIMRELVSEYLGSGRELGCTDVTYGREVAWGWNAEGYVVRLYRPASNTARKTAVRLVIGLKGFDLLRLRPCVNGEATPLVSSTDYMGRSGNAIP
jgi:hypothetical protein